MFTPETGGALNKVYHFYAYRDMAEREVVRQAMVDRDKWLRFLDKSRPHVKGPQARRRPPWVQAARCTCERSPGVPRVPPRTCCGGRVW
jgi:NIPSNAP